MTLFLKFFFSRDVVFHKQVFPFHSLDPSTIIVDPFPDLVLPQPGHDVPSPPSVSVSFPPALVSVPSELALRNSTKVTRPPSYLQNYHCHLLTQVSLTHTLSSYPLEHFVSYSTLSPSHR